MMTPIRNGCSAVVIPAEALQQWDEETIVFVAGESRTFAKRPVKPGHAHDGKP